MRKLRTLGKRAGEVRLAGGGHSADHDYQRPPRPPREPLSQRKQLARGGAGAAVDFYALDYGARSGTTADGALPYRR